MLFVRCGHRARRPPEREACYSLGAAQDDPTEGSGSEPHLDPIWRENKSAEL